MLPASAYSNPAHIPAPHWGRPQPKDGAPALLIGSSPPRPVWAAAGTLSCFATSKLPQLGHRATSLSLRIKVSKVWSQGSQ